MKLWVGKEKEGCYQGKNTLFVGHPSITVDMIKPLISKHNIEQLYFGAGGCSKINKKVLRKSLWEFDSLIISAEIHIDELNKFERDLLKRINVIITVRNPNFNIIKEYHLEEVQLKMESQNLIGVADVDYNMVEWTSLKNLCGKKYKTDRVLL